MLSAASEGQIAWLAGLYEGEGSCGARRSSARGAVLQMSIKMTDLDVLERAQSITGLGRVYGPYRRGPAHYKPQYAWTLASVDAYAVLIAIWPMLLSRRQEQVASAIGDWLRACRAVAAARPTASERFWVLVDRSGSCWTWTGCHTSRGQGHFALEHSKAVLAHRFAWQDLGGELSANEKLLNTCGSLDCVNPEHYYRASKQCRRGHLYNEETLSTRRNGERFKRDCRVCREEAKSGRH